MEFEIRIWKSIRFKHLRFSLPFLGDPQYFRIEKSVGNENDQIEFKVEVEDQSDSDF